ncbi:hypothetical protein O6P43_026629 [Quillaja saponaria]|uniref:Secreted protein n=1 Tax=Quillaja saponaria TaxID=32244 RepID=A0AAD7L301_QUISA|nr:hypothetical protein O6P43_026629 [Quillaja saponaria]
MNSLFSTLGLLKLLVHIACRLNNEITTISKLSQLIPRDCPFRLRQLGQRKRKRVFYWVWNSLLKNIEVNEIRGCFTSCFCTVYSTRDTDETFCN